MDTAGERHCVSEKMRAKLLETGERYGDREVATMKRNDKTGESKGDEKKTGKELRQKENNALQ